MNWTVALSSATARSSMTGNATDIEAALPGEVHPRHLGIGIIGMLPAEETAELDGHAIDRHVAGDADTEQRVEGVIVNP